MVLIFFITHSKPTIIYSAVGLQETQEDCILCPDLLVQHVIQNAASTHAFPFHVSQCEMLFCIGIVLVLLILTFQSCIWHFSLQLSTFISVCQLLCHCLCTCGFMLINTVGITATVHVSWNRINNILI